MDIKIILTILHLFGVALGAGGAFVSDAMFFKSVRDANINSTEVLFLKLGGFIVWSGLVLLAASGAGLFLLDIEHYLSSSKFLAKMTIVAILIVNGVVFHLTHIPRIIRHANHHLPSSDEFIRKRSLLAINGAISTTSWISAIILGSLSGLPYSYGTIMAIYGTALCVAILGAILLKNRIIPIRSY